VPDEDDRPVDVTPRLDELGDVRLAVGVVARAPVLDLVEAALDVDDDQGRTVELAQLFTSSRSRSRGRASASAASISSSAALYVS
jgi:hypothetical protein